MSAPNAMGPSSSLPAPLQAIKNWFDDEVSTRALDRFRIAFAAIWLAYDVSDLAWSGTWSCLQPDHLLSGAQSPIVRIQLVLIALEVLLLVGFFPFAIALAAAYARGVLAFQYFRLNDFLYYCVTAALLAVAYLDARPIERPKFTQRWILTVMRIELGFVYLATAVMKLNPSWLSGAHLYVRLRYLREAYNWPYPSVLLTCMDNARCAGAHAWAAIVAETLLGALLIVGKAPRLALLLSVGIHTFGALGTNVWFFGASMVAHVAWLGGSTRTGKRKQA